MFLEYSENSESGKVIALIQDHKQLLFSELVFLWQIPSLQGAIKRAIHLYCQTPGMQNLKYSRDYVLVHTMSCEFIFKWYRFLNQDNYTNTYMVHLYIRPL